MVVAKKTWGGFIEHRRVLYFIDNDSARYALIKLYSQVPSSCELLWEASALDVKFDTASWYARVPSASNPADGVSRLKFDEARALWNAEIVEPKV